MRTGGSRARTGYEHQGFRTTCGRDVRAGRLALGDLQRPVRRVSLEIGKSPGGPDGTWAALTVSEARRLAAVLLAQAAAAEHDDEPGADGPAPAAAGPIPAAHARGGNYPIATPGPPGLSAHPPPAGGGGAAG